MLIYPNKFCVATAIPYFILLFDWLNSRITSYVASTCGTARVEGSNTVVRRKATPNNAGFDKFQLSAFILLLPTPVLKVSTLTTFTILLRSVRKSSTAQVAFTTMAWRSSGASNEELVNNLYKNGLIKEDRVRRAMLAVRTPHRPQPGAVE